jgi:hypothetical protein
MDLRKFKIYFIISIFFYLIISNYIVPVIGEEGGEVGGGDAGGESEGGRGGRGGNGKGSVGTSTSTEYTSGNCSISSSSLILQRYLGILCILIFGYAI